MQVVEVSNIDLAFGRIDGIIPAYKDIPDEYKTDYPEDQLIKKFREFTDMWFFCGVHIINITPKEGIDKKKALRMVTAVIKSFEPSHEHKQAGVTYLMHNLFDDVEYETRRK